VTDRLSALDASFLFVEEADTAMHVGGLAIFDAPPGGLDVDALERHIARRIGRVPRFRQRVRAVPGGLARPVWVDDAHFDLDHHVRRSHLPRPGGDAQLDAFVARVMARPLDRDRPLWELYVIEGLSDGRFAILTKTHHAIVDGVASVDLAQVLLDPTPEPPDDPVDDWSPRPEPSDAELVASAVGDMLRTPGDALESFARRAPDPAALLRGIAGAANGVVSTLRAVAAPAGADSLSAVNVSDARVFARVDGALADHKLIREVHGATVNDVVLTVVAGALRAWLMARGEPVHQGTTVRALVPVSLRGHHASPSPHATGHEAVQDDPRTGNHVSAYFVELPVGEPNPVIRLQQVAMSMRGLKDSGQALGAQTIISLAGYAPSTVHAMAARTANTLSRRVFGLMVTNVPGPQFPLYVIGARLRAAYPVAPLAHGQAIAIGVTSYDGSVFYGLLGDREAMPDMDVLAQCLGDSLAELVVLSSPGPIRRRGAR